MRIRNRCVPARFALLIVLMTVVFAGGTLALAAPAYLRQPDLHGDTLVFCAEADLWAAPVKGGEPRRITTHPGNEFAPSFSPDGTKIAFSALYDGNQDVYVVSTRGGEPRRLTWHPGPDEVIDWMPGGKRVIFRSRRGDPMGSQHLYTVDLAGGDAKELPLGWASRIDVDAESGRWAFTRNNRENRPWKRYRGGWASDIWVGHPDEATFRKITDFDGMDHFPMWHAGRIFFLSDKGGTSNIWSVEPDGRDRRKHTDYTTWDIRWPAMADDGRIVFTMAADIYIFDPVTDKAARIDVDLASDVQLTRVRYPDGSQFTSEFAITPEGDRLAVVARGEIFSVPVKEGVTLPITRGTGARERSVVFDPDGKKILYLTDETREEEIRVVDAWGRDEPDVVKRGKKGVWHYQPEFSPDGEWIAFADDSYGLFVMAAEGRDPTEVDRGTEGEIRSYTWSPGGRWLAYRKTLPNQFNSLFIYDTREKEVHEVTGPHTNDYSPAWDPDGRYLYFASDRDINPLIGEVDFSTVEMKNDRLYMLLLREDVKNPFRKLAGLPPEEEEDADKNEGDGKKNDDDQEGDDESEDGDKADEDKHEPIEIDFEGLQQRVVELPVALGNYTGLGATSTHLFFVSNPVRGLAESGDFFTPAPLANELMSFSLEDKEAKSFVEKINGYRLALEGKKIAIRQPGGIFVVDAAAPPGAALAEGAVDLSDIVVELDPRDEWAQIYHESWRQMREFYWDEQMSGVDWDAIRDQYAGLLPRLAGRADLSDLIAQVFGEMNTSHTYVFGGDPGVQVNRVPTGLLGADLVREGDGAYRVATIFHGSDPDRVRSPLDVPGVDVNEGDYILAVNQQPVSKGRPFHAYLENLAGKEVVLTVNAEPRMEGSRKVVVTPVARDGDLRYADWVRRNREYVLDKTGGKMGYIHIPDMLNPGMIEFNTWFYPQLDREGMVVDVRWNGGGSYSQLMLERFRRKVLSFSFQRGGAVGPYPYRVLNGPFVVLVNESSGSDGDIFPQAVQLEGLAPIIGTRTWGGVNGITSLRPLVDGGLITQSQVAWWDPKDGWGLENRGVIPDVEVVALPQDIARGIDRQLDRGIEELMRLHAENPPIQPDFPPSMRRSRKSYRDELNR